MEDEQDSAPSGEAPAPADDTDWQLPEHVVVLRKEGSTYYLLGTAHVSETSVREVEELIEKLKPDAVCVELCQTRYRALTDETQWEKLDIFRVVRQGKMLFLLAQLAIGAYQRRLGAKLGIKPGAELLAAAKKAEAEGARVVLVDRDIQATLKRTWARLGFFKKASLLAVILDSLWPSKDKDAEEVDIEELKKDANLSQMMDEFAKAFPQVHETIIDERDRYLIAGVQTCTEKKVLAVVGAGHLAGMQRYFGTEIDREALAQLPKPSRFWGAFKWILPIVLLAAFYYGYDKTQGQSLVEMLTAWILPTSMLAGVLTLAAGGRMLSVVAAALASPLTTLHPLIGAGMVVGLVEAWLRKPTVSDAQRINDDVQSFKGIYRNPFTRVLLVATASTIGAALGAWIGLSWVLALVSG
jgi:pheromone shutdown-related protein TraB